MTISSADWQRYVRRLSAIDARAAARMQAWMERNPEAAVETLTAYAWAIAGHYGSASAALACEMYDATAAAQGAHVAAAVPAATATLEETGIAVRGTMKNQRSTVPATVSRLVKQAGADTVRQNAARDGAEWAWVPSGDTCAFCMMLASNGWQRQGKKAARGQHAEHIHANCDCTYAVRFDGKSGVADYDPKRYYDRLVEADPGGSWGDRINAVRREQYAAGNE